MTISKYTSYFHDGDIYDITQVDDKIIITMESAEVDPDDILDNIPLSKDDRIKGELHIEKIKSIKENKKIIKNELTKRYPSADILHLEIESTKVKINIRWDTYSPSTFVDNYSAFEIDAEKVYWENIPELVDPNW